MDSQDAFKQGKSSGFIPNYKNFYQMFYGNDFKPAGMDIGHKVGARENWGHHHEYILSEAEADDMLKEEFSRRGKLAAKSPNPQEYMQKLFNTGIGNMYTRKYSMDDSDYAQLSSGIYSDSNATILSKILTGLPWTDGNSNKRSALGTKLMPFKLATIALFRIYLLMAGMHLHFLMYLLIIKQAYLQNLILKMFGQHQKS